MDARAFLASLSIQVEEDDGKELLARCPSGNHADNHPSWTMRAVGKKAGVHVCRSCGFKGGAVDLAIHGGGPPP